MWTALWIWPWPARSPARTRSSTRAVRSTPLPPARQKLYDYMDRNPDVHGRAGRLHQRRAHHRADRQLHFHQQRHRLWTCSARSTPRSAGIKHISGTGGQLDFVMGAYLSKGGKSFICMSSTVTGKDGSGEEPHRSHADARLHRAPIPAPASTISSPSTAWST